MDSWTASPLDIGQDDARRFLPEGPYALASGQLSWVAIQHGDDATIGSLNLCDLVRRENQSFDLPGRPGFAFPRADRSDFVVGCERSLGFFDPATGQWDVLVDGIDSDVDNTIINDGLVVDDNLIFGTKDLEFANRKAGLYLYRGRDGQLVRLRDDQVCSNGKAVYAGQDGSLRLIDIDSPTRQIVGYPIDIDTAILGDPEVLVDLNDDPAVPDGAVLTPDASGIIVSMYLPKAAEYGETRWYDLESGALRGVWRTPQAPQNTCPALVPMEGDVMLVITTAVENMSPEDFTACPNSGLLFVAPTPFKASDYRLPPRFEG
ncbi:SMP-30/gluconolactonase/LRE family protein [Crateriforma conspicua]|uniref:SMP-30/Gluconolaconase/LRE-like region n=1 Tax=Crateriforma conspicua TaxID=2527996 RepID=A0A5C6FX05_9PLAN|nr:SMP-30/gluconolactonase/LRE family protein [Crateriforma conspicua]TWU67692.1 SMP-30/Gluconolaconase/LRE-like region [Crateriforma conspicua]